MEYTIVLAFDRSERVYNVSVPALPGCFTWGKTKRQALGRAKEAIQLYLESLADEGQETRLEIQTCQVKVS